MIVNPKFAIHLLFHSSGLAVTCIQVLKTSHGFGIVFLIFFPAVVCGHRMQFCFSDCGSPSNRVSFFLIKPSFFCPLDIFELECHKKSLLNRRYPVAELFLLS